MVGDAEPVGAGDSDGIRKRKSLEIAREQAENGNDHGVEVGVQEIDHAGRPVSAGKGKKRKSDEMSRDNEVIETRAADIMAGSSAAGAPIVGLPSTAPTSRVSELRSKQSKSRNRGMSLRSSLFSRNMDRRVQDEDTIMEMQPVTAQPQTSKKDSQPEVTVSPIAGRAPSPPWTPSKRKGSLESSRPPTYVSRIQQRANRFIPMQRIKALYEAGRKAILRIHEIPPSKNGRHIALNPSRTEPLIDERTSRPHISNTIRSSKYTAWNFIPRQLFAQFSKLANFYFLVVSILQMIPGLSTTGQYTTIIPLLIFVSISMAKEGLDDLRRYRLDKVENRAEARVLRISGSSDPAQAPGGDYSSSSDQDLQWETVKWHSIRVGDVIKLHRDEAVPADLVLIKSTGANNVAYVDTMALDGETNLKPKQPFGALVSVYSSTEAIAAGGADFVVEDPNLDLYNFEGKVTVHGQTSSLTNNEIVYRGSIIRNTPEALGLVIYSGEECKIRMNANKNPRIKAPTLQNIVNKVVILIACFVIILALFCSIAYLVWQPTTEDKLWYVSDASVPFGHVLSSYIIMFNTLLPLSLYVCMEIVKVVQMGFLNEDIDMYDEASNTPFEARTSTINEELGQVQYVFSDKTGTLTENVMRFRKMSVGGMAWAHDADAVDRPGKTALLNKEEQKWNGKGKGASPIAISSSDLTTTQMIRDIQRKPNSTFARQAKLAILSMALCHTCLPERDDENNTLAYQASSPDELALVQAARELGYVAWDRDFGASILTVKTYPQGTDAQPVFERFEVLDVVEFSSKRKRMSVVVKFPDGRLCLICKGADTVIMKRLRLTALAQQKPTEVETRANQRRSMEASRALQCQNSQIDRVSGSHPRTSQQLPRLSIGRPSMQRQTSIREEVDEWLTDHERDAAPTPRDERHYSPRPSGQFGNGGQSERQSMTISKHRVSSQGGADDKEELVEESLASDEAAVVERCFQHINDFATEGLRTLLYGYRFLDEADYRHWRKTYQDATTSLVDRQQRIEEAGELIEQNLELGCATAIEDKLQHGVPETIERLRRANIKMWMLTGDKRETAINIGHSCRLIKKHSTVIILDHELSDVEQRIADAVININQGGIAHSVVVVDGQTLAAVATDEAFNALFLDLAILADSVVCCRASPSQKAGLVNAIRKRVNRSVTLAIGDGANDIAMIQEAHVGIGITGKEGLQAARVSDYSIAQFRFLAKLILVHGRWNYVRMCKYTLATFWKEMLFYTTQALYQRWTGYTGTSLYESWSLSMFNTLFASLVVIFLGIFEQDLRPATLLAVPELYHKGQRGEGFNFRIYIGWTFMAASEAMIIYFTMKGLFADVIFTYGNDLYAMGVMTFTACIVVIATKIQVIEQRYRSVLAVIAWVLAVGGWFLWNIILAADYENAKDPIYRVKHAFFTGFGRNLLWWLVLLLIVVAVLGFEITVRALKCAFSPTDVEVFQTLETDSGVLKRFEEASALWLQQGWNDRDDRKTKRERATKAQTGRDGEVHELRDVPRTMEEGRSRDDVQTEEQAVMVDGGPVSRSTDIQEMLSRRFGKVRKESLAHD